MKNKKLKQLTIKEIRGFIEANIKATSDETASRIYEVMTGRLAVNKSSKGTIRVIT
tara:strand:+ start:10 stop:177 length:168 start_codon:yes stop_codon:yes gene_type:complete